MKKIIPFLLILSTARLFAQHNVTTIECDNVVKATDLLEEVSYQKAIETVVKGKIESCSKEHRTTDLVASEMNPFVFAVHTAYAQHRPLVISPDMIWLLICQGFTKHIDYHSKELRSKFVTFSGKKKITIATESIGGDFYKGNPNNPWELMFPAFTDSINKVVGKKFSTLISANFSTTTPMERAAFEVTLMDAMSNYFEYGATTACGIPQIYVEGSMSDWKKIKENLARMKGYKIDYWIAALNPIIDEFIHVKDGKVNHVFWESIYKVNGGSGGPYISGWLPKFFPYLNTNENKPRLNKYVNNEPHSFYDGLSTNDFYNGMSQADFTWDYHGTKFKMEFLAGFIGVKQDNVSLSLRPEIGWAVREQKKVVPKKQLNK